MERYGDGAVRSRIRAPELEILDFRTVLPDSEIPFVREVRRHAIAGSGEINFDSGPVVYDAFEIQDRLRFSAGHICEEQNESGENAGDFAFSKFVSRIHGFVRLSLPL